MTATFWTGSSLSFTNGSKTVTVNTGPSLDSVKANSSLTAGNYNEPVEVKSVSGNTIILYNNWPGSTGTTSATIKPSAAAAASAGVAAQQLITDIQSLVSSASATATANSFVKRDSNGRIKASAGVAADEVVVQSQLGSAATRNVGSSVGNVMEVGAFGLGSVDLPDSTDNVDEDRVLGFKFYAPSAPNLPIPNTAFHVATLGANGATSQGFKLASRLGFNQCWIQSYSSGNPLGWVELYHSGNTNFNQFGGTGDNDVLAVGYAYSTTGISFYIPLNSKTAPTGVTLTGTFSLKLPAAASDTANNVSLSFSAASSNKYLVLLATGLSGLTANNTYVLQAESTSSKIKVNF